MWNELVGLIDEVRKTHNTLVAVGDDLHAGTGISTRLRAVLEYVSHHGPTTVPEIARARRVTRQHIQTAVNELLALSLMAYEPNPQHRRSHLVALTGAGARTIDEMQLAEQTALGPLLADLDPNHIAVATETLRSLRAALPDPEARLDPQDTP
jgi:DNA-binding MarR family transcriptional regulator